MKFIKNKKEILIIFLLGISAFLLTADPLIRAGQPATFDGTTHITTMAQYYTGLASGQFPVVWADGFANYGMPIPLIAQQTTNYVGASLNFLFQNILFSFNFVFFLGAFLSTIFFYIFLRFYFKSEVAFLGAFLFNFSAYRIINIYIRGALPEFFATTFIPLVLIGFYYLSKQRYSLGAGLLIFSHAMLLFTHPFMFVVSLFLTLPYALFLLLQIKEKKKFVMVGGISMILGVGLSLIYIIPLMTEIKYFYYGLGKNHFIPNQFLTWENYFDPNWYYYYKTDTFVRGNFLKLDLLESLILLAGLVGIGISVIQKRLKKNLFLLFAVIASCILIFFTLSFSEPFYRHINLLANIQYPWRMLSALIFIPPLILCFFVAKSKYASILVVIFVILIALLRFPQVYGKNYTVFPEQKYFFTPENLHGNILNTVWTGKTSEYPVKSSKHDIIDGKGKVVTQSVKNGFREYTINADTSLRMVDYTFYFPGWRAYVDGQKVPIEYQNPDYRGAITYTVPQGEHKVKLEFGPTKERIIGLASFGLFMLASIAFLFILQVKVEKKKK